MHGYEPHMRGYTLMQRQRNKLCKYLWRWSEQSKSNRRIT